MSTDFDQIRAEIEAIKIADGPSAIIEEKCDYNDNNEYGDEEFYNQAMVPEG